MSTPTTVALRPRRFRAVLRLCTPPRSVSPTVVPRASVKGVSLHSILPEVAVRVSKEARSTASGSSPWGRGRIGNVGPPPRLGGGRLRVSVASRDCLQKGSPFMVANHRMLV